MNFCIHFVSAQFGSTVILAMGHSVFGSNSVVWMISDVYRFQNLIYTCVKKLMEYKYLVI
jgi:hypothetical protein